MRRGIILPLIFLLILAGAVYYIYANYSQTPNETTKKTAADIFKYPNSSWTLSEAKNICLIPSVDCIQPINIEFESADGWTTVYSYYRKYMTERYWKTNSEIITSIPTSIIFEQAEPSCKVSLEERTDDRFHMMVSCRQQKNL